MKQNMICTFKSIAISNTTFHFQFFVIDINICFPLLSNNTTFNFLRFLQRSSLKIRCYESNVITNASICLNPPIKKKFGQHQLLITEKIVSSITVNLYKVPNINLILAIRLAMQC